MAETLVLERYLPVGLRLGLFELVVESSENRLIACGACCGLSVVVGSGEDECRGKVDVEVCAIQAAEPPLR